MPFRHGAIQKMRITALMACKNEDWIAGLSLRAAMMWVDSAVVLLHDCSDGSARIVAEVSAEYPGRVIVIEESEPVWREMAHRHRMLEVARADGATHICYLDFDEILTGDLLSGEVNIRHMFRSIPPNSLLQIPWLALRGSIVQVHVSGPWAIGQNASFGFVDDPRLGWQARGPEKYDFHHRAPMGKPLVPWTPLGPVNRRSGLMHLQFVSGRRLRAKQCLYKLTEVLRWPDREPDQVHAVNQRYNLAVYGAYEPTPGWQARLDSTIDGIGAGASAWWEPYKPLLKHFHPTAAPWQEAECQRLIAEHGAEKFAGLDLFGVESARPE